MVVSEAVSGHDRVLKVCHSLHLLSKGDLHGGFDQKDWNNTVIKAIKTCGAHVVQPDQHVLWETFQCDDGAVPKQGLFRIKNYINNGTPCPVAMLLVTMTFIPIANSMTSGRSFRFRRPSPAPRAASAYRSDKDSGRFLIVSSARHTRWCQPTWRQNPPCNIWCK